MPISYSHILVSPEVAEFLEEEFVGKNQNWQDWLQDKFLFPSHGLYLKPIDDNIFSARTNIKKRLLLVFVKDVYGNDVPYIFNHYEDHKLERPQDKDLYKAYNKKSPEIKDIENPTVIDLGSTQTIIYQPEMRQIGVGKKSKKFPKLIAFDRDQCQIETYLRQLYQQEQPYCVNSIAGSGKTCLALLQLANILQDLQPEQEKLIYLTKSPHLAARQQKEFAKSYPQLVDRVEFLSYNQFLERNKKEGTLPIATYQNFLVWYQTQVGVNKDRKFKGKQYPQSETLYDEFNHLSGNYDSQDGYSKASAGHCRFNKKSSEQDSSSEDQQELNREDILELYKNYQENLSVQKVVDPIKVELKEDLTKSPAIIIDEAQLLTKKDCEKIKLLSKAPLQFFCDSNQGPITFKPEHLAEDLSASQQLTLTTNHRSSKRVITFAKLILGKISKLGVVGEAKLNISASQKSEEGEIDWQISDKAVFSEDLTQAIKNNPNIYLIITTDDKKNEVQTLFPENVVMTPVECQGIEYPKVVLFECFSGVKEKAEERSRVVSAGSKPKQKDPAVLKKIKNLRILFSIITRAQESIVVVNSNNQGVQSLRAELEEEINKSSSEEQITLTKQSSGEDDLDSKTNLQLSTPAKHIIAAANIYSSQGNPEIIMQQVVAALKGIKEEYSKNESNIASLTKLIQENYDNLTKELCQEIVEALSKNIGNIELYNILLSQNFDFSQIPDNADLMISINGSKLFILIMQSKDQEQIKRLLQNRKPLEDKKFTSENIDLLRDENLSAENFGLLLQFLNPKFENVSDLRNDLEKAENDDKQKEKLAIFFNHFAKDGKLKDHIKKQIKETINQRAKPQPFILDFLKPEGILNIWQEMMKNFSKNVDDLCYLIENYHQHILPDDKQETIKAAFSQQSNKGNSEAQIIKFIASITNVKSAEILSKPYSDKLTLLGKIISTVAGLQESDLKPKLIEAGIIPEAKEIVNQKPKKPKKSAGRKTKAQEANVSTKDDLYEGERKDGKPDGIVTINYSNGNVYQGEWANNKMNGTGRMNCENGDFYEGLWSNGQLLYGRAKCTNLEGNVYEGEWSNNQTNGVGKITYKNGDTIDGRWLNGIFLHGAAECHYLGNFYKGHWSNDKPDGTGTMLYKNGDVYEGQWRNGKQNGQGKLHYSDGVFYETKDDGSVNSTKIHYLNIDFYEGEWVDGLQNGNGVRRYKNGNVYEGQWRNGKPNGQGRITYKNGNVINGEWENGELLSDNLSDCEDEVQIAVYKGELKDAQPNVQSKITYDNGDVYEGELKDGKPNGQGKMTYTNGDVYKGQWKDDKPDGAGKMIYKNGDVYEGQWRNGKQNGQGKLHYSDGVLYETKYYGSVNSTKIHYLNIDFYEGEWVDGLQNGNGVRRYKNGNVYEGELKNGIPDGKGKMKYANGDIYEGEWKDGNKNGRGIEVKESYQIIGNFSAGKPSGNNIRISKSEVISLYSGESPQLLDAEKIIDDIINDVSQVISPQKNDELPDKLPSRTLRFSEAFKVKTDTILTIGHLIDRVYER